MKQIFLPLAALTIIALIFSQCRNDLQEREKITKNRKQQKLKFPSQRARSVKRKKININKVSKNSLEKEVDINKLLPCEAFKVLQDEKEPWTYLKKSNVDIYFKLMHSKIPTELEDEELDHYASQAAEIITQDYIIYSYELMKKLDEKKNFPAIAPLFEYVEQSLIGAFEEQDELEHILLKARYFFEKGDKEQALSIIMNTDLSNIKTTSFYNREVKNIYKSARTPSELAAAFQSASAIPIPDFRFLLELKKFNIKSLQKKLDKISMLLIKQRLRSKYAQATDYAGFALAQNLHSQKQKIKNKYGDYKFLLKRQWKESRRLYGEEGCDDRELIDLCDKLCQKE